MIAASLNVWSLVPLHRSSLSVDSYSRASHLRTDLMKPISQMTRERGREGAQENGGLGRAEFTNAKTFPRIMSRVYSTPRNSKVRAYIYKHSYFLPDVSNSTHLISQEFMMSEVVLYDLPSKGHCACWSLNPVSSTFTVNPTPCEPCLDLSVSNAPATSFATLLFRRAMLTLESHSGKVRDQDEPYPCEAATALTRSMQLDSPSTIRRFLSGQNGPNTQT